jgi:hypothetical protein
MKYFNTRFIIYLPITWQVYEIDLVSILKLIENNGQGWRELLYSLQSLIALGYYEREGLMLMKYRYSLSPRNTGSSGSFVKIISVLLSS